MEKAIGYVPRHAGALVTETLADARVMILKPDRLVPAL
jgi:hypothetical protein